MATGKQPFAGKTAGTVFNLILSQTPTAPRRINPELPDELERILDKALEKDKTLRYQHASDLKADLDRLRRDITAAGVSVSAPIAELAGETVAAEPATTQVPSGARASPTLDRVCRGSSGRGTGCGSLVRQGVDSTDGRPDRAPVAAGAGNTSIAVLPFVDRSPAKDQEYFADGLSEELLNVLAQIRDLKVAGRTSSFQFKGQTGDLRLIGEKLNVATILEGSVRKASERVRITARLVNVADGFHLWSQTYDRTLDDIFAVQDDIAASVAAALEVALLGGRCRAIPKGGAGTPRPTTSTFKGSISGSWRVEENLERAIEYLERSAGARSGLRPGLGRSGASSDLAGESGVPDVRRGLSTGPRGGDASDRAGRESG